MKVVQKFIWSLFLTGSLFFNCLDAAQAMPNFGNMMGNGGGGMLPMPTPEELKEIEEFLSKLSPEELDQLAQLGEEIIKKAEEENMPLFFDPGASGPVQPSLPTPAIKKDETKPTIKVDKPAPTVKRGVLEEIRDTLDNLIKTIESIRQKTSFDQMMEDTFSVLDDSVNKLVYYLHVVNDRKIAPHLKDAEFSDLYKKVSALAADLKKLDTQFDVPEFGIMTKAKEAERKKKIKKSAPVLNAIIRRFKAAIEQESIPSDLIKLIEKYEPEALKIKTTLQDQEKKALEYTKKVPAITTNKGGQVPGVSTYPAGGYNNSPTSWNAPAGQAGYNPAGQPRPYSNPQAQTAGASERGGSQTFPMGPTGRGRKSLSGAPRGSLSPYDQRDPEEEDEDENNPTKKTTSKKLAKDLEIDIKKQVEEVNNSLIPYKSKLDNYFASYDSAKNDPEDIKTALNEVNFTLKKLKSTTQKWNTAIQKEAKTAKDLTSKTKEMNDFYNSINTKALRELKDTLSVIESNKVKLEGNVKKFKEYIDDFEKKIKGQA